MSAKHNKIKVGISVGDTNGIGVEVIIKALAEKDILEFFTPIIFGSTKLLSYQKNLYNQPNLFFQGIFKVSEAVDGKINVFNLWKENINIDFGKATEESGKMAFESLEAATAALKNNDIDVLITAPINKDNIQSDKFKFPGHTEYLAHQLDGEALMFMISDELKVALVTQHIPLQEVVSSISKELIIKKALQVSKSLKEDFGISKPKIAILGLNPHAGDNGLLGKEEIEIIIPAIEKLKADKNLVFGPYSPDSFFVPNIYKNFDAVLAMYHDQGLIPFKTIVFEEGVNFTANLSQIRTSPDHGVAYNIAGKNQADETSFKEAIFKAIEIYKYRKLYKELTANVLKKSNLKEIEVEEDLPIS